MHFRTICSQHKLKGENILSIFKKSFSDSFKRIISVLLITYLVTASIIGYLCLLDIELEAAGMILPLILFVCIVGMILAIVLPSFSYIRAFYIFIFVAGYWEFGSKYSLSVMQLLMVSAVCALLYYLPEISHHLNRLKGNYGK